MAIQPLLPPWPGTMTGRERFRRQMHFQSVDRSFNMEFGYWNENFTLWPLFAENGIHNNEEADLFFSFDRIEKIGGNTWMSPPFEARVVEQRDGMNIIINSDGLLAEVPADGHDTIPHYLKSSIVTPDDWKRCKEERFRRDDPARILELLLLTLREEARRG